MFHNPPLMPGRRQNPDPIPQTYYTTWQAPPTTPGATQVANGPDLMTAVNAAGDGDTIELTTAGQYAITTLVHTDKVLNITALVEGCYLDGAATFTLQGFAAKTSTFTGVEFRNGSGTKQVYVNNAQSLNLIRCRFNPTTNRKYASVWNASTGTITAEGCIWYEAGTTSAVYGRHWMLRNCVIDQNSLSAVCVTQDLYDFVLHNCAMRTSKATAVAGTVTGDYNLSNTADAPGANSHDNITWADEFDASYLPKTAMGKTGGDPANAAALDYLGNDLSALAVAPIGAIIAV